LHVYEGTAGTSENLKQAYESQVLRTASNVAGILASFLDTRGMELHGSANQQQTTADTHHTVTADHEVIDQLTSQRVISTARAVTVLSMDAAYRHG